MSNDVRAAGLILCHYIDGLPHWLLLQNSKRLDWGFPKGHQDAGESDLQTALRECAEEACIALVEISGTAIEISYPVKKGRNKTVVYYPALTEQREFTLSKEHCDGAWCTLQEVLNVLPHKNIRHIFHQYLEQENIA